MGTSFAAAVFVAVIASCSLFEDPPPCVPQFKVGDKIVLTLEKELPPGGVGNFGPPCKEAVGLVEGTKIIMTFIGEVDTGECTGLVPSLEVPRYEFTASFGDDDPGEVSNRFSTTFDGRCSVGVLFGMGVDRTNPNLIPSGIGADGTSPLRIVWASSTHDADPTCPPSCGLHFAVKAERFVP